MNLLAVFSFIRLLASMKPDLVVTNTIATPIAAVAAFLVRIPHVWYVHEFGADNRGFLFDIHDSIIYAAINRLSRNMIVNSEAVRSWLENRVDREKIRLVYCSVEVDDVQSNLTPSISSYDGAFRAVLVGRKETGKGQVDAILAVSILRQRGVPVQLALVGSAARGYEAILRSLVAKHNIEPFVDFVDFTPHARELVASADVTLMCSRNEAFGLVTVEAMKLGTAVIGANSGGTAELICDGQTGLLYESGDAASLADRIEQLYCDPGLRSQIAAAAQDWATATFTSERYALSLESVFLEAGGTCQEV